MVTYYRIRLMMRELRRWTRWGTAGRLRMASGAVAGATAERIRFFPLCTASILLGGLLLPVTAHWAWYTAGWPTGDLSTSPAFTMRPGIY